MLAIYKKELKTFFTTVTGWLFIAAHIALAGLYLLAINLLSGYGNVADTVSNILFLLLLTTPVLSMRILAEERKQKTDQLILTSPVSVSKIVGGKYLAMATVFTVPVLVMATFPLILTKFGSVAVMESYTAILVYYLFGLTCLAISLFVSSLTESQVIAAVLSFAVLFIGYMMSSICSLISSGGNLLTRILGAYDFMSRLEKMLGGTLDLKAVFYFLTLIVVFLFLTVQSIQKRRYHISVKTLQFGAYSTGMIAMVLVIAVFANMALSSLPDSYTKIDVTDEKLYSITDTTKNLVKNLNEDVTIYILANENTQDSTLAATLQRYEELSDHIKVVYKDPVVSPDFYKDYTDSITMNSLIVESEKRFKTINYSDIYEYTYDYTYYTQEVTGYDAEGLLTSAIAYVTGDDAPVIYQLTGHDEMSLSDTFVSGLKKSNADLSDLTLLTQDSVPEDADGVIVLAPAKDLGEDDADKLISYLEQGGKILMETAYVDYYAEDMPNLSRVLEWFGISIGDGLILEQDQDMMYQHPAYLLPEVSYDSLTNGVYGNSYDYIMMPYGQPIVVEEREDVDVTTLLSTSDSAYAKTGLKDNSDLTKGENDAQGPFTVGVKAEKEVGENTAQLILYSSEILFTDSANQYTMDNNLTLFTNAVSSMIGEEESVSVPVKSFETYYLTVPAASAIRLGVLFIGILPVGMLIIGIVIWIRRKRK
ncbi:MAG: Gldg family protein [Lachnospiraceae bacterium]|nr:Gldg family protein [Lachnospiraceae bacterium]